MNKREFLRASGALLAGGALSRLVEGGGVTDDPRTNWSGNYHYSTDRLLKPSSVDEARKAVKSASKLRVLGTRHSFNGIADSTTEQLSLMSLKDMHLDAKARTVTVGAGVKYGELAPYIDKQGFALHNLASLPHISVAGARSTATHGSGIKNGNLATVVSGLELVTADGEMVELSRERDGDRFLGAVVDLGALGAVTKVTLEVQPTYEVSQVVYENLSFDQLEKNLDEVFASGYSVSLFTDWQYHRATQVWVKSRIQAGKKIPVRNDFFGAKPATRNLHPVAGHSAESCTEQMGVPGPWYERLPHFRMNFTPSSGSEIQTEYLVPRERGYQAILAVEKLKDHITPHLYVTELRTIAADDLWMSTAYKRDSMAIHFTWKMEPEAVNRVLPMIEEQLAPFDPRPHWAKVFRLEPSRLRACYQKLGDFKALATHYDPSGKFRNAYLNTNLYA
jgi:xylitol oxidase